MDKGAGCKINGQGTHRVLPTRNILGIIWVDGKGRWLQNKRTGAHIEFYPPETF